MTALLEMARTLRRRVRELTGEARWDDYLAECADFGEGPMSRREFERHRSEHRETSPSSRCC